MIVVGVDVHKQSLTAVAVDEAGRAVTEVRVGSAQELLVWSASLEPGRLWALEDCRQLTRRLEAELLAAGERLVRVPRVSQGCGNPTRSTRSPSREPPCASRALISRGRVSSGCVS